MENFLKTLWTHISTIDIEWIRYIVFQFYITYDHILFSYFSLFTMSTGASHGQCDCKFEFFTIRSNLHFEPEFIYIEQFLY